MPNRSRINQLAQRKSWQERSEAWREKIRVGVILERLQQAAEGKIEMSPTAAKAAQILLNKAMPDLHSSEIIKKDETQSPAEMLSRLKEYLGEEAIAKLQTEFAPHEPNTLQ